MQWMTVYMFEILVMDSISVWCYLSMCKIAVDSCIHQNRLHILTNERQMKW